MHPALRLLLVLFVSVLTGIGAAANNASADTVKVWKWKDADGRVVYSQQPPPGKVKAEEMHIDPDRNVIESGWPAPAPGTSPSESVGVGSERDSAARIARQGGAATTEEAPAPPPVIQPPIFPPPATVPPPAIIAPPTPPAPPIFPSPGPGGF